MRFLGRMVGKPKATGNLDHVAYSYAASRINDLNGRTSKFGRLQACVTTLTIQEKLLPALRGLELVASGGVLIEMESGEKNCEARRFLGWTTERHWVSGPNREDDPAARQ
jgi:hypothetical protein